MAPQDDHRRHAWLQLMLEIKALWDAEGFGTDETVSEPLYARLCDAIDELATRR